MSKTIAIIDPCASAAYLSNTLSSAGVRAIAVFTKSLDAIDSYFKISSDLFDQQIFMSNPTPEEIAAVLAPFSVDYVLNGSEFSTKITDQVASKLTPELSNNPDTSHLRCDKFHMQEALKSCGLRGIDQIKVNLSDIDQIPYNKKISFPCFCKPLRGLGTIGAFKASNQSELLDGLKKVLSKKIVTDTEEYLIQEFIEGQEFFVDAFSYQGKHYISSIQQYQRQLVNGVPVLRYSEIVYDEDLWNKCSDFAKKALRATGLFNGFSHTEIFLAQDNQMRLIEINPRISGGRGYCNKLAKVLKLNSQIDLMLSCLNNNQSELIPKKIDGFARRLYLFNWSNSPLKDPSGYLKNIPAINEYELLNPIGHLNNSADKYVTNIDLFVLLHSQNFEELKAASQQLFTLEKQGNLL